MINFGIVEQRQDEIAYRLGRLKEQAQAGLIDPELGTLPKQAQLLCEACIGLTPPFKGKLESGGNDFTGTAAKEMGENATARDVNRSVRARDQGYLETIVDITKSTVHVRQEFRNKKGQLYLIDVDRIDTTGAEIESWHKSKRDRRGRVSKRDTNLADPIGRWKAHDVLWAPAQEVKTYIDRLKRRVGWAKAGWLAGYLGLGGTRAPQWITRHGFSGGTLITSKDGDRPFVKITNRTKWGMYNDEADRTVAAALRQRANAMKSFFETNARLAAEGKLTRWQTKIAKGL